MNILFDIWCGMSRRDRAFCWGAGVVCLSLTAALLLCYPGWQTLDMQQARLRQQRDTVQQQWRTLRRLTAADGPFVEQTTKGARPFSPLDFQSPSLRLLHWQPSAQGGEMALKVAWEAVPPLFSRLAESEMGVRQFSLRIEEGALLMTLQLERLANEG
ncbi:hypothetical protein [Salmonella bongori]|uniref:DNA utilization protein HofO C-terminal domain-containing protein n=2 Tax=Salmonella TaxID=590 RepID=A0A750KT37_SALER|nr:hypothetical protein [Salmonella bongori]AID26156.1 membrane protein [Salmonella bongori serovar 48:z41:-- str. RKS3044]EGS1128842.1 hypothetical protein [Salmonella bongori CFSAN000509]HAC6696047.1 hypothetical protein [Salmonella bongori serovar 44:r:-]